MQDFTINHKLLLTIFWVTKDPTCASLFLEGQCTINSDYYRAICLNISEACHTEKRVVYTEEECFLYKILLAYCKIIASTYWKIWLEILLYQPHSSGLAVSHFFLFGAWYSQGVSLPRGSEKNCAKLAQPSRQSIFCCRHTESSRAMGQM